MYTGFIGTGSMGQILVEAFIRANRLSPEQIIIHNRTRAKAEKLARDYPGMRIASNNEQLVRETERFFICVKPKEFPAVLSEIRPFVNPDQLTISITSPVLLEDLEQWLPCKVAKIIPSIANKALSGTVLYIPGSRLTAKEEDQLKTWLGGIGTPLKVAEDHTRIASDLASCGPAFLAKILEEMATAASRYAGISLDTSTSIVVPLALSLSKLLTEDPFTLSTLIERVAVPGGITSEGLKILEHDLPRTFQNLFAMTHQKYRDEVKKVKEMLVRQETRNESPSSFN
jgi:competence protein ComER